jgi:hypothetical protein
VDEAAASAAASAAAEDAIAAAVHAFGRPEGGAPASAVLGPPTAEEALRAAAHPLYARFLARAGGPEAMATLVALARSADVAARRRALGALRLASEEDIPAADLRPALADPDDGARASAVATLARAADLGALGAILDIARDPTTGAASRAEAREAARLLAAPGTPPDLDAIARWWAEAGSAALDGRDAAIAAAFDEDAGIARRLAAVDALGSIRDGRAREALTRLSRARREALAIAACRALGAEDLPAGLRALVRALREPRPAVASAARLALVRATGKLLPPDPALWEAALR